MNFSKKLLTLLAIFCVIASAGVVCAADHGGYAGSNYQNMNGYSGSQYYINEAATSGTLSGDPGNDFPIENQTGYVPVDANGNPITNATGNTTGNATHVVANATGNTTGNNTGNSTVAHTLPVTGNPIIALLAVTGIIGGYAALRRNK